MNQQPSVNPDNSYKSILATPVDPEGPVRIPQGLFSEPMDRVENKINKNTNQK